MEIIFLLIGAVAGAVITYFLVKNKSSNENVKLAQKNELLVENLEEARTQLKAEQNRVLELTSELSKFKADYSNLQLKLQEQKAEVEKLQEKFKTEFENLANKIFEEKSNKFTEQNKTNIDEILNPLKERIKDFEKKVNDVYVTDSKERARLIEQIKTLHELNQQMSKDAANLTNALKGEAKSQGNWGEVILERILEKSGLVKGREYLVQQSFTDDNGKRFQPDVVISLPEEKSIIVDSKVSLVAYERYNSADDISQKNIYLKEHINSIRRHVKELSEKNYQNIYGLKSLDFVLMFLPIEPAFGLAVQNDLNLFQEAFDKNIVIVSPSTLLATLRTIASIWRQENQNRNAIEIAEKSGALYDKFVGLLNDLKTLGGKLNDASSSYEQAISKLKTGKGNLISRVEKIKILGAKATKTIPSEFSENDEDDDSENLLES